MTFQKFLSFLIFPLSIAAYLLSLAVSTVLWVLLILSHAINDVAWKLFEPNKFSFYMQGVINWLDDAIAACYVFALVLPAMSMKALDNDLY
jgi:hypothetical protein